MTDAGVFTGLDILLADPRAVSGKRVGLITNASGVTRDLRQNIDALRDAGIHLIALFSPEHGLLGAAKDGAHVSSGRDARTGLPIHSLYGDTRKPTAEMLNGIDVLLFDIQDVGVRFYTYTATLALALEACAENKIPLVVLDRPDAINGVTVEGPVLDPGLQTFVGHGPLPIRFAMTLGELAQFYNAELNIGAELRVIAMQGWRRALWYDETALPWVLPSPNMPTLATATVYPGMCLVEGTNLSIGRGTTLPFEIVGAPWIDSYALADAMNRLKLDGVRFRPIAFTPSANKFANENCFGVQVHVIDRKIYRPVTMTLNLISTIRQMYQTKFEWNVGGFNRLMGDAGVIEKIDRGESVSSMANDWQTEQDSFRKKRERYLLYD